ncbi:MAG: CHAD domain-containing protein [Planctomycetes bacterium]|nr:CHAD domain-containing protein [Planctomycetota bacterium]
MPAPNSPALIGPSGSSGGLLAELDRQFGLRDAGRGEGRRIYLDTPERRLTARGERLWASRQGSGLVLFHLARRGKRPRHEPIPELPRRVGVLPSALRRCALRAAPEDAALEVLAVVDWRLRFAALENGPGKDELLFEERRVRRGSSTQRLPAVLVVHPGAGAEVLRRVEIVASEHGYRPIAEDELEAAMRRATPSIDRRAAGARPAGAALLDALREERAALRRTLPTAITSGDPDALHQMRIALRRTRALLSNFRPVLPARSGARFAREFAWLQSASGRARDLDVLRLQITALPEVAPRTLETVDAACRAAREELRAVAESRRAQRFFDRWDALLARTPERLSPLASTPLAPLVHERLSTRARKLRRAIRALAAPATVQELHELRIAAKKLRYVLESFGELLRGKRAERLLRALRRVQEELGSRNDAAVQVELLRTLARDLDAESAVQHWKGTCSELAERGLDERLAKRLGQLSRALRRKRIARLLPRPRL